MAFALWGAVAALAPAGGSGASLAGEGPPPAVVLQPSLEEVANRFAQLWLAGDVAGLSRLLASSGVRLHLERGGHAGVGIRQAAAALRDFHADRGRGSGGVTRVSQVGGSPPRGSAELNWRTTGPGSAEVVTYSVFLVFLQEGDGWRVSEIRVLR